MQTHCRHRKTTHPKLNSESLCVAKLLVIFIFYSIMFCIFQISLKKLYLNFQLPIQPVKSLKVVAPVLTTKKKWEKLKCNDSPEILRRIEVTEQTAAPHLERQTDRHRISQLTGTQVHRRSQCL